MLQPREIIWRRVMDDLGFEHASVGPGPLGATLTGTVLVAEQGAPLRLDYRIECDEGWRTRQVIVMQVHGGRRSSLRLDHDGEGQWQIDGRGAPGLAGCIDVDLGLSPSTNALPVNRLGLEMGAAATIRAAWMRFPGLEVVPSEQSYERLEANHYRYRNVASGFEAGIEVDADGLPIDYSGIWERMAEGAAAPAGQGSDFVAALVAPGPAAGLGRAADDLGWLVGGWEAEVRDFSLDGRVHEGTGEWWFSWVLEGRAMQDVWISPPRNARTATRAPQAAGNRYGTTIRHFDRKADAWHVTWINPVSGAGNHLAGRRDGDRMVLLGEEQGTPIRWSFEHISASGFLWRGESRQADGSWRTEAEFRLRRIGWTPGLS